MKEHIVRCTEGNPLVSITARVGGILVILYAVILACGWITSIIDPSGKEGIVSFIYSVIWSLVWTAGLILSTHPMDDIWKESAEPATLYLRTEIARALVVVSSLLSLAVFSCLLFVFKVAFFESLALSATALGTTLITQQIVCAISIDPGSSIKPPRDDSGKALSHAGLGVIVCLIWLGQHIGNRNGIPGAIFLLSNVTTVAFLWMESDLECIARREIIPLSVASVAWLLTALGVYLYGNSLHAISAFLPYFIVLLPATLLSAYYYLTQPVAK
jgi:hypothetical protein